MNEHDLPLSPDDPRLTAYAFGELDEAERQVIEAAVQRDPALQAAVRDLRALGGGLTSALGEEPLPTVVPVSFSAVAPTLPPVRPAVPDRSEFDLPKAARLLRFPGLYYVLTGAAAAGFALLVAVRDPIASSGNRYAVRQYEVRLSPPPGDRGNTGPARAAASRYASVPRPVGSTGADAKAQRGEGANADDRDNPFVLAAEAPVSTFAVDVGTEAYAEVRRLLQAGQTPPLESVRIEELVNHFPYRYEAPARGAIEPVAAHLEVASAPWAERHRLVRIGLQGRELAQRADPVLAEDVRFEVEFNPAQVAGYRLLGYEQRRTDPGDSTGASSAPAPAEAGRIEAGYRVTALYEIIPVGEDLRTDASARGDARSYSRPAAQAVDAARALELLTVTVRYRDPESEAARLLSFPLVDGGAAFDAASPDFQFAAAVAGFGLVLRDSPHRGTASLPTVVRWAELGAAFDPGGHRADFLALVRRAETLVR